MSDNLGRRLAAFMKDKRGGGLTMNQAARRAAVLERQSKAKEERFNRLRNLHRLQEGAATATAPPALPTAGAGGAADAGAGTGTDAGAAGAGAGGAGGGPPAASTTTAGDVPVKDTKAQRDARRRAARERWADELQRPEWMIQVPADLNQSGVADAGWMVKPRPAGRTVLLVATGGQTTIRNKNGAIVHVFQSALPHGSKRTHRASSNACLLECVFGDDDTLWATDVMCWKGVEMWGWSAQCRFFMLASKLAETPVADAGLPAVNKFRIRPVPCYECDVEGLRNAAQAPVPYTRDGLLFCHKGAKYEPGLTPTVLLWRDSTTSPLSFETVDVAGHKRQVVCLQLDTDGTLLTDDGVPLGATSAEGMAAAGWGKGTLLRFSVESVTVVDGKPALTGVQLLGQPGSTRLFPDSWSKVFAVHQLGHHPVTLAEVVKVAAAPPSLPPPAV